MKLHTTLVLSALAVLTACQSHRSAMEIVCNASSGCADCNAADPAVRATHLAEYIAANVTNDEAVQMFASIASLEPGERARALRDAAARAGLARCAMADELEAALPPSR